MLTIWYAFASLKKATPGLMFGLILTIPRPFLGLLPVFFYIFIFFKIVFYINIFLVSQFTDLYSYRRQGAAGAYI